MNERDVIEISSLPHPISMFLLGLFTLAMIILWVEYRRMVRIIDNSRTELKDMQQKIEQYSKNMDEKIGFVSRKIDSRIDKALLLNKK
jgi:hypothetical protein